jgi:hypothetical protein
LPLPLTERFSYSVSLSSLKKSSLMHCKSFSSKGLSFFEE